MYTTKERPLMTTTTKTTTAIVIATVRLDCVAKTKTETAHKQAQRSKPLLLSPSICSTTAATTTITTTTTTTNVAQQQQRRNVRVRRDAS
ncbi:hypothetical protein ACLKA7_008227 [Drosophila subpalustris]